MRASLAILLSLLLILLGQTAAVARAAPPGAGEMVVCSGSGPVTLRLDANGDPAGPPHVCPDCTMHLLSVVLPDPIMAVAVAGAARPAAPAGTPPSLPATPRQSAARDPPRSV